MASAGAVWRARRAARRPSSCPACTTASRSCSAPRRKTPTTAPSAEAPTGFLRAGSKYPQAFFFRDREQRRRDYEEKYGAEAAAYLIEVEAAWLQNYTNACLILWEGRDNEGELRAEAEAAARDAGLPYREVPGGDGFLRALLEGGHSEGFLRLEPGFTLDIDGNGAIAARPVGEEAS